MKKPAIAIIQARMSSSRLPGKVMLPLAGKPMIWHIVQRVKQCHLVNKVIVATSTDESDIPLANYCKENGIECYQGSLTNVMSRYLDILTRYLHPYYVRITGDCPLIHPPFIDAQILALDTFKGDITWVIEHSPILEGQGVHSSKSLKYINNISINPGDKEHVGSMYYVDHPEEFKIVELKVPDIYYKYMLRLTVDEENDYMFISSIYNNMWESKPLQLLDVLSWLRDNPQISSINTKVQHTQLNLELINKRKKWLTASKIGTYIWEGK